MNYKQAIEYIHSSHKFGIDLGLDRINRLMDLMGHPERLFRTIHVAGTNGKGSTSAFIESILRAEGYKTGLFTSPYLERFTERIKVQGEEISAEELAQTVGRIKSFVDILVKEGYGHPTEFEIVTAIGFEHFRQKRVDYAVIEVGLGGRLDATNIIKPEVAIITSISMDHTNILGSNLESISREKAGIIKENIPVVLQPQMPEAFSVIKETCSARRATLFYLDKNFVSDRRISTEGQIFTVKFNDISYKNLFIRMLGRHQTYNAAAAVAAAKILGVEENAVRNGLKEATWPGRMEILRNLPFIVIDGAHNVEGAEKLVEGLKEFFPSKKVLLVFGMLKDKDVQRVAEIMASYADRVITTSPDNPRRMEGPDLSLIVRQYNPNVESALSIKEAVDAAFRMVRAGEMIVFAGSLYMIGEVRRLLPPEIL